MGQTDVNSRYEFTNEAIFSVSYKPDGVHCYITPQKFIANCLSFFGIQTYVYICNVSFVPTEKGIPLALAGKDILSRARTGSGKTATYALPILQNILSISKVKWRQAVYYVWVTPFSPCVYVYVCVHLSLTLSRSLSLFALTFMTRLVNNYIYIYIRMSERELVHSF